MKTIFLIGFMGCGKSAVSSYMKQNCHMQCIDTDDEIEKAAGMHIPQIFEEKGEAHFRTLETQVLCELQNTENMIVSCGGGIVLNDDNVAEMKKKGVVVLLTASPETILERVKDDDSRPLLKGNKKLSFIQEMMNKRKSKYEMAADMIIETDGKSIEDICKEILTNV